MRRIVWVAIGAAGGIIAYRRAQQAAVDARERGVVLSAQQVGMSAMGAVGTARSLAATAAAWTPAQPSLPGAAAAKALARPQPPVRTERGDK
jgi:hypothetical protein